MDLHQGQTIERLDVAALGPGALAHLPLLARITSPAGIRFE